MGGETAPGGARNLIFVSDGTLTSLAEGEQSNAGLLWKMLREVGPRAGQLADYDPGVQGKGWFRRWFNAATGNGLSVSVCQGYSFLTSRYRPGDRIMLFGYSRGAYAVRSLAGLIDSVGLVCAEHATERRIRRAYRFYETGLDSNARLAFSARFCHENPAIEFLGVWDTVKALGLPFPVLSRLAPMATEFHNHRLGRNVLNAMQALAIDEDRTAFRPVLWQHKADRKGRLEQVWFAGSHGDVGGQIAGYPAARGLSNVTLGWMLERAEACGLMLPEGWRERHPLDPGAPAMGPRRGIGRLFLIRRPRVIGTAACEAIHPSVEARRRLVPGYAPKAVILAGAPGASGVTPPPR